ncbi:MAG TPA: NAD(P)/FAD-dependent oxidoreductase [Syntrophales bacterium]|nr:NAD(P)/FAD-dependent oxidoreductase [Syntrophales bacterium]
MPKRDDYDAVVVGAGPNGLAAAITLSRRFKAILLLESAGTIGGGLRSKALTLPGFIHDVCSTVQPLSLASPFFRQLDLPRYGVEWIQPEIPLAHPFEDGPALYLHRSLEATADAFGPDGQAYKRLLQPFVDHEGLLFNDILKPLHFPGHPLLIARFAFHALRSLRNLAETEFKSDRTRALFAGLAAHAMIPLEKTATAAFGLILATLAHTVGWPIIKGGSQKLADALADCFRNSGGEIITGRPVASAEDMPKAASYFFDVTPRQLINIKGLGLTDGYRKRLARFRYGPGVYKMDWALKEPIPWKADICRKAGTVHLGESFEEIAASIREVRAGNVSPSPYIILAQQSLFDPSRAPAGRHTAWAYCHVPHGSAADMSTLIENKIERYAPGFREVILARSVLSAPAMEQYNANYVGGDINGGIQDLSQLYTRPIASLNPYRTSAKNIYLCSSSTPPGGGVHGLCGYYAALSACK